MMKRVGYLEKSREQAVDLHGKPLEILELHINGARLAIRVAELRGTLAGRIFARVERLERRWGLRVTGIAGLARLSASGKALNIELNDSGDFTVSLDMLRAVLYRRERFATIAEIPEFPGIPAPGGRPSGITGQQRLVPGFA